MPGVFVVHVGMSVARAIDEMLLVVECSTANEWSDSITYFPLA